MNNEILLLNKNYTDTLIEQNTIKPRDTFEFNLKKQRDAFLFDPPLNLFGEGKWVLAVTSFQANNYVFILPDEKNNFSFTTQGHWKFKSAEKTIDTLHKLLQLRSENEIELNVEQV